MITFSTVGYKTPEYEEMLLLRKKILREPLGLSFSEEDSDKEADDIFCIGKENGKIIACCILTGTGEETIRLRQMAVDTDCQGKGAGISLLRFAEETARRKGAGKIILHARLTAEKFYEKSGYQTKGKVFTEVGIPHVEMEKKQ